MSDHVYKTIEITGSSNTGTDGAIRSAVQRAAKTIHDLRWFEVIETRGEIRSGDVCFTGELYDDDPNVRLDGSRTGIQTIQSDTSHSETHSTAGTTLPTVQTWLLQVLTSN